jgi:diguanylate cyclase (GGDEF)-like protein
LGLGGKLSLYAALLILLTTCTLALNLAQQLFEHERQAFSSLGLGLAHATGEQAEIGVFSGDAQELGRVVNNAAAIPGVAAVSILDPLGHVLVQHGAAAPAPQVLALLQERAQAQAVMLGDPGGYLKHAQRVEFAAPVLGGSGPTLPGEEPTATPAPLGYVLVSLDTGLLYGRLQRLVEASLRTVALLGVLGTAGMAWLARRAVRPLREVTQAARMVAEGNLDHQLDTDARDEANVLAQAFNQMTARLRESRDTLEQRVAERTDSLRAATAEAYRLAKHDALTGLPNRALLRERLERALETAQRRQTQVAVLFVDLDHFKTVNDSLGHECGDVVLRAVAQRLAAQVPEHGFAARLGGDEFVVVREDLLPTLAAMRTGELAQRLMDSIGSPIPVEEGQEVRMGASIGMALHPGDGQDVSALLRAADTAMYEAKRQGRMGFHFFTPAMDARVRERLHVETDLRRALKAGEFELWYQPQFNVAPQQLVGAEALVRWRHPERGLVSPALFIPVAEETGLIRELGAWVLDQAARDMRRWASAGAALPRVAVNVSAHQFNHADLVGTVERVLAEQGLPPQQLELELTESGIVQNPAHGLKVCEQLRAMGVQLSIDDFGTGYSSLSQLTKLPVQTLKIDRSFIAGLPDAYDDVVVVEAICAMAHKLRMQVLAEGVETEAQLQMVRDLGCDAAQGYFFSRPMPAPEFEAAWLVSEAVAVTSAPA